MDILNLKPCPLCGERAAAGFTVEGHALIVCKNYLGCGAKTTKQNNIYDAVVEWNEGRVLSELENDG